MQTVMRQAILSVPNPSICLGCRVVAGRRHRRRLYERSFSTTRYLQRDPEQPVPSADSIATPNEDNGFTALPQEDHGIVEGANGEEAVSSLEDRFRRAKERNYGSASRRVGRNKKPKEAANTQIPLWFLKDNVHLASQTPDRKPKLSVVGNSTQESINRIESTPRSEELPEQKSKQSAASRYTLNAHIWKEILLTVRGGLELAPQAHSESLPARKSHVVLQCPKDGGIQFLESIVEKIASEIDADLITVDAQDIAEVSGDFLNDESNSGPNTLQSLGYDTHQLTAKQDAQENEDAAEEEEEFEEDEEDESPGRSSRPMQGFPGIANVSVIPMGGVFSNLQDMLRSGKLAAGRSPSSGPFSSLPTLYNKNQESSSADGDEVRIQAMLEAMISTVQIKRMGYNSFRKPASQSAESQNAPQTPQEVSSLPKLSKPLLIHVKDYKEINATLSGGRLLTQLYEVLQRRRHDGQHILLIGTTSSADLLPMLSKSGIKAMQSEMETSSSRTIIVTPERSQDIDASFIEDERLRIRQINSRHLRYMIQQRAPASALYDTLFKDSNLNLDSTSEFVSGISESVWPFDRVHRIAQIVIGTGKLNSPKPENIGASLDALLASDEVKYRWVSEEKQQEAAFSKVQIMSPVSSPLDQSKPEASDKLKRIRKQCNSHEKKLLSGVIDPANIKITFKDVHAPAETIEALKTLTSLSLVRPEAFSYGVLATDKLSGLLLYGPPGTGKTMLAKAVAKESGATMLEVSGAEIYDMYVGEGEKNTKAVFTLAKKLAPCVIFLDEADALFGSRGSASNRTSHRELINQFLKEIEGIDDPSAFIMVATNRPFDLDDAVLRRLPRRLLVDLPVEKDREDILRLHLQNEALDESVSIPVLAEQTPLYSGSDLKNVAVAAALACVREENEAAAHHKAGGSTAPYTFAEKRTLSKRHFDRALEEISASISEDMSSLTAIRKFDEKYGDRKGRRKRAAALGFGSAAEANQRRETGRVRN